MIRCMIVWAGFLAMVATAAQTIPKGFVYLDEAVPGIVLDIRYAGSNNFVGEKITGYDSPRCVISSVAANRLILVQRELSELGLGLKVFDAYRPQRSVDHFVRWARDLADTRSKSSFYPNVPKSELFERGYIAERSGHSRGSAVDATLVDVVTGTELDMGTAWDLFDPLSWPSNNEVSLQQRANRLLLKVVMTKHGFRPLKEEWWHFTLENEPFPDTYFDFVIE
ncbi:MAG: M15 family metallopeptidase [Pseudomonadota bacterium]